MAMNPQTHELSIGRYREDRSVSDFGKKAKALGAFDTLITKCSNAGAFMEQYIKERESQLVQKYKDFIGKNIQSGGLPDLKSIKWKAFIIGEIFERFAPGKSKGLNHLTEDMFSGKSYVGATNRNNGVLSFVQADIFAYANWLNKYIGLFITTCSDMSQEKYSHGYKWTKERLLKSGIMLPANEQGNPDYNYMEQYGKQLMLQKYQQYLDYIGA